MKAKQPDVNAFSLIPRNWATAGDCDWGKCHLGADIAKDFCNGEPYESQLQQEHVSNEDREISQILEAHSQQSTRICEMRQHVGWSVTMSEGQSQLEMANVLTDANVANKIAKYKQQIEEQDARKEEQLKTPEALLFLGPEALYKVWDSSLVGMHTSGHRCANNPDASTSRQQSEQCLNMPVSVGLFKEYSRSSSNCQCTNDKQCRACRAVRQLVLLELVVQHIHLRDIP